jgi:hypothetical protein
MKNYIGIGGDIGVGVGTALGVALHNIPVVLDKYTLKVSHETPRGASF